MVDKENYNKNNTNGAFINSLGVFFLIIVRLLTELLRRIKEASINETMHKIAHD